MKTQLALCDSDPIYGERLKHFLGERSGGEICLTVYSSREGLEEAAAQLPYDLFLLPEGEEAKGLKGPAVILRSSQKPVPGPSIFKYQPAEDLYRQLLFQLSSSQESPLSLEEPGRMVAFLPLKGGIGTSTLCAAVAASLARQLQGQSVLYFNMNPMEYFPSTRPAEDPIHPDSSYTIRDLLFAVKSIHADFHYRALSCQQEAEAGLFYFLPCREVGDFYRLTQREWARLLSSLKKEYDLILFDFPSGSLPFYGWLLEQVDGWIWLDRPDVSRRLSNSLRLAGGWGKGKDKGKEVREMTIYRGSGPEKAGDKETALSFPPVREGDSMETLMEEKAMEAVVRWILY